MEVLVMRILLILLIISSFFVVAQGDSDKEATFGIKFSGFVKTDIAYDTRQTVSARNGQFLLYPAKEMLDEDGDDVNAVANFNMFAIQSRLKGTITAPDAFGAKTSGVIEGAFFGLSNADINGFRLRHAFLKLDWETMTLLVGQYWHPMFITDVFPGTVSFDTGVPFQPFARNPQVRFIYRHNDIHLSGTAATQLDFTSTGPAGGSSDYLRNAGLPILNVTAKYKVEALVAGAGVTYKTLRPRIENEDFLFRTYKTDVDISSFAGMAFCKIVMDELTLKAEGIYSQNSTDLLMLGGYAVSDVTTDGNNFATEYTNIATLSAWADLVYGKKIQFGLFAGYTENLGADKDIVGAYYSRGMDIASVMRLSPRLIFNQNKTRFAVELEYTAAAYGTANSKGKVENTTSVANLRLLCGAYLFF
jgi:hypothetical protein